MNDAAPRSLSYASALHESAPMRMSVGAFLRIAAGQVPLRTALVFPESAANPSERRYTYQELLSEAEAAARRLLRHFKTGEHVAIICNGQPELTIAQLGAALAGIVLIALGPLTPTEDLVNLLRQADAVGMITNTSCGNRNMVQVSERFKNECENFRTTIYLDQPGQFLESGPVADLPPIDPDHPLLIVYTSGTTGKPKPILHMHQAAVGVVSAAELRHELDKGSIWLPTLPALHWGGMVMMTLGCIANLGTQIMMPVLTPETLLKLIERYRVNYTHLSSTVLLSVIEHPSFGKYDLSSLRYATTGAGMINQRLIQIFKNTLRVDPGVMYGLSEAGGMVALSYRGASEERLCSSVGHVIAGAELKIALGDSAAPVPITQIGEICVRTPYRMKHYYKLPRESAEAMDDEGWIHTGDAGFMHADGYVQISGRLKELIFAGETTIFPREIESLLSAHPDIAEAAVFGVPDPEVGQRPVGALRFTPGHTLTEAQVMDFLRAKIDSAKIPSSWMRVEKMPTNLTNKVQKSELQKMWTTKQSALLPHESHHAE